MKRDRGEISVVAVQAEDTYELRRLILRKGTPLEDIDFPGDRDPGTVHLAVRDRSGTVIATSTWSDQPLPDRPGVRGVRLRGMAVRADQRGRGLGAALVNAGTEHTRRRGAALVWANARDTALDFYLAYGFAVIGDGFVDADTELPHHRVVREL